ncbi:phage tail fiber protein [Pseudescherichia vulneris]|uniref:phage tail fiber protein n=1 Tax=Pseudescherichia vulneris TaxID=566 RepID=UPI0028AE9CA1|nr:phage tail protein [Pseudescherichia vulneris]
MIYTTGTIAGSGSTLTGTGTNFAAAGSLIRNGCTVITMTSPPQVFQITGVTSATQLAVSPAVNPAIPAGTRYSILLSDSLSVDGLAQDIAETFGMYQRYMSGFADVMTGSGNVTITINGTSVTVPAQKSLAQKAANGAVPVTQGGTSSTTAEGARTNLGLILQSTNADSTTGRVLTVGAFGLGSTNLTPVLSDNRLGFGAYTSQMLLGGIGNNVSLISLPFNEATTYQLIVPTMLSRAPRLYLRVLNTDAQYNGQICEVYTTTNTTKGADGTLKAASPIARIVKSQQECTRPDIDEQGFSWCGDGTCNEEAQGISITRLGIGEYKIVGSAGLAKSGWRLSPPRDPNGSGDLGIVEAEETEAGGITIRLFKRRYVLTEDGDIELVKGVLIDVPANSWIDARLDMPEKSAYNQRLQTAQEDLLAQQEAELVTQQAPADTSEENQ